MLRHLGLFAGCACIVASVGCGNPIAPTPTVTVEFGGRVVNADTGGPVANVRVSVNVSFAGSPPAGWVEPTDTATSGGDGTFALPLNLPSSWRRVSLKLTAPTGYDDTHRAVWPAVAADRAAIRMYRTLVIRPGDSIDVRVDDVQDIERCGWGGEAGACRRVVVAASPGDPVELELVPDDSSRPMGLSPDDFFGAYAPVRHLTLPPGSVPYVIGDGTARLTARR